jgi:phosphomannomutase
MCESLVVAALQAVGCDVIRAGLATTPTVEMAVLFEQADGGIVLSASHNPAEWNALKLLNDRGEFLDPDEGSAVIGLAESLEARSVDLDSGVGLARPFVPYDRIGVATDRDYLDDHIEAVLALPFIDASVIREAGFRVVVDGVNSVGGVAIPRLLESLGVEVDNIHRLNCEPTGHFAHPAEPLPENLVDTIRVVGEVGADLGIVVDPDADRLALIEDGGRYVSEELTQVIAADFMWGKRDGPFATNLSSSRAIDDVAAMYGQAVFRSAVGEINVVKKMQEVGAILGGEGNGGVIVPDLHYGRDALAGVAIVLQHLAETGETLSALRSRLPSWHVAKLKAQLGDVTPEHALSAIANRYSGERVSTIDGVKVDFEDGWVHLRKSNTEPIVRVYAEARTPEAAQELGGRFLDELRGVVA